MKNATLLLAILFISSLFIGETLAVGGGKKPNLTIEIPAYKLQPPKISPPRRLRPPVGQAGSSRPQKKMTKEQMMEEMAKSRGMDKGLMVPKERDIESRKLPEQRKQEAEWQEAKEVHEVEYSSSTEEPVTSHVRVEGEGHQ